MKYRYDDLLEALRDALHPIEVILRQYREDGFGTDELKTNLEFQTLYVIEEELRHIKERVVLGRLLREQKKRGEVE